MLAELAAAAGAAPELSAEAGAEQGRALAEVHGAGRPRTGCVAAVTDMLAELGFDPAVVQDDRLATIAFTQCPYAELAAAHPEVVCHLHRGLIEGFVESIGGAGVDGFRTLADRDPCQVELSIR